jgi:CheY-like chemotaxis protein
MSKSVILLVEDEEESRETLRELLEIEGYAVETAFNGKDALATLNTLGDDIRIVLLDLFMPVMDGWQVIAQLRADGRLGKIPLVVTTSAEHDVPTDVPVLHKPLDLEKLLRTVEKLRRV